MDEITIIDNMLSKYDLSDEEVALLENIRYMFEQDMDLVDYSEEDEHAEEEQ